MMVYLISTKNQMDWEVNFEEVTGCIIHLHPPAVLVMAFKSKLEGYSEVKELLGCHPQRNSRLSSIVSDELECLKTILL